MNRILKDLSLTVTKALPAAAANTNSDSIQVGPGAPEGIQVLLIAPAVPALVDAKTIAYTFQHSDDDSDYSAIAELATLVQTGASSAGAAAAERRVYLPPSVKKYIRVNAAVLTGGGDNTAKSFTLEVVG